MGVQIPPRAHAGRLAQLVRAPRSHRGGQWFESTNDHINIFNKFYEKIIRATCDSRYYYH